MRLSDQIALKAVQVLGLDDALQIQPVLPVFLHLYAAALPHGGGKPKLVVGQQHPDGVHPVTEHLVQLLQQLVQPVAGFGAGQQDVGVKAQGVGLIALVVDGQAGDIGAVAKLNITQTGDTIAVLTAPIVYHKPKISTPYTYMAYAAKTKGDEDKISSALAKMMDEDLTLRSVSDTENRQTLLYGIGEQQLEVVVSKLQARYKVDIVLSKPKFAFRETLRKKVEAQGKYKKQSGGHGQYGDVKMSFEPSGDLETPYVFEEKVFGGAVPKNYFPAVEKGIQECVQKGPLAGYPVVGVKATLLDGSYHPVDSSEMAFKTAAIQAFKKGFMEASPVLLEPIVSMKITVDDKYTGDIMGDLNKRRGRVLGMNPDHKGHTIIEADVPELEIYGYGTTLRSMTGGSGDFSYEFARYEQAPSDIQAKEIEARASKVEKAEE